MIADIKDQIYFWFCLCLKKSDGCLVPPKPLRIIYYILPIKHYELRLIPYALPFNPHPRKPLGCFCIEKKNIKMNKYYDPNLSQKTLETYQGYSLQVFTSGRIKLSFHITHRHRNEYYAVRPNRFREAYAKQHQRSHLEYPEHFALVSDMLACCPNTLIHRVHLKGDNNATVDHAHALTDISGKTCHVVLDTLHHAWELPTEAIQALHLRGGPKVGSASIFNEYMPSYEHDWMDAVFECTQYTDGYRSTVTRVDDDLRF